MGQAVTYSTLFVRAHPFGVVAGVRLPPEKAPVPESVVARLLDDEQRVARGLDGFRAQEWVGARLAWHEAAKAFGLGPNALLSGDERQPLAPTGVSVSLTHKRDLAIALVGHSVDGALGVDLEGEGRARTRIAERVLRPEELAVVQGQPEARQWLEVMVRFAVKEAIYKAVHPTLRRYVGFEEARVEVDLSAVRTSDEVVDFSSVEHLTRPHVTLLVSPPPRLECVAEHAGGRVLAAVRARW
jgi:4'-phosphopantetheinyl transferase EntD